MATAMPPGDMPFEDEGVDGIGVGGLAVWVVDVELDVEVLVEVEEDDEMDVVSVDV